MLRQHLLLPELEIQELEALARRVHAAVKEKAAEEELLQVCRTHSYCSSNRLKCILSRLQGKFKI